MSDIIYDHLLEKDEIKNSDVPDFMKDMLRGKI